MTRRCWVYINGVAYEKGTEPIDEVVRGPIFMPDLPDFVSPIDKMAYSGRAGMREHNARHNVVRTDDLKGLKPPDKTPKREEVRQAIVDTMYRRGYLKP